ncbi:MAG: glycosyltransferase family 4 protein [Chloroflexi bacterium]|nr:glycosyltransferase family 4 protein [Chloroflexota bacterium]
MKILFVADGRSPISQNWIRYFANRGDEIYLASTFACDVDFPVKRLDLTPVAFSQIKKQTSPPGSGSSRTVGLRTLIRQWIGPGTIRRSAKKLRAFINEVQPDIVHAMRIPYEGMLAAQTLSGGRVAPRFALTPPARAGVRGVSRPPFVVSIWGNDFTLHAPSTPWMGYYTRKTMQAADALHSDCERDVRLAREWSLSVDSLTFVAPGNGGIRSDVFYPNKEIAKKTVIINPRGFRAYVKNESFFKAIPLVLAKRSDARFVCSSMAGEPQVLGWIKELKIEHAVQLNPPMPHTQMGDVFRAAQIVVSPSVHDGTPNSLLEGMACGCFPIAGDLESIREWITHGQNGLLIDPNNPQAIADAILIALEREDLRREAAGFNANMISARAEYERTMERAGEFYGAVIKSATHSPA